MLKIIIELHPYGDSTKKRQIASMDLWNNGLSQTTGEGHYEAQAVTEPSPWNENLEKRGGNVTHWPRANPLWSLVRHMLISMGY